MLPRAGRARKKQCVDCARGGVPELQCGVCEVLSEKHTSICALVGRTYRAKSVADDSTGVRAHAFMVDSQWYV